MKNLNKDIFILDETSLNRQGLYEYALNIGANLGVDYVFAVDLNGEQFETPEFRPNENRVIIPARLIDENLTERDYRAAKGGIDHEAAHVLWPDTSYLYDEDKKDEGSEDIKCIGNIIDDIRIERRMVREYQVDANNFKYLKEKIISAFYSDIESIQNNIVNKISLIVDYRYRAIEIPYLETINKSLITPVFMNEIAPVVDRFINSDEKAGETAKGILKILGKHFPKQ